MTSVQVREKVGTCRSPMLMRDYVDSCTGNLLLGTLDEDYRTYCKGWLPLISENCTRMAEYEFRFFLKMSNLSKLFQLYMLQV